MTFCLLLSVSSESFIPPTYMPPVMLLGSREHRSVHCCLRSVSTSIFLFCCDARMI